jgi:hypothetical protein
MTLESTTTATRVFLFHNSLRTPFQLELSPVNREYFGGFELLAHGTKPSISVPTNAVPCFGQKPISTPKCYRRDLADLRWQ